jgi:hypothetical protein
LRGREGGGKGVSFSNVAAVALLFVNVATIEM